MDLFQWMVENSWKRFDEISTQQISNESLEKYSAPIKQITQK